MNAIRMTHGELSRSRLRRLSLAITLAMAASGSFAQTPPETAGAGDDTSTLDAISVTGSRIKRAVAEGPAPVTVITAEQMKREGFATVYDALLTVTEALGEVEPDLRWGQSSPNAYPLNLRNLGPGRSLLLINGHRVADYPMPYEGKSNFANFNNIPSGIVERVEILAGSASAIYGSDAMGGVVNIILKEHADAHVARVRWGGATRGGSDTLDVVLSGGFSFGARGSLVYNLQHYDREILNARDRPESDEEADKPFQVWGPEDRYYGRAYARWAPGLYLADIADLNSTGTAQWLPPPEGVCEMYGNIYFPAERRFYDRKTGSDVGYGTYCAERDYYNWVLRSGSKDDSGYAYATWDFSDTLQGWTTVGMWHSTGSSITFLNAFGSGTFWDPRANDGEGGYRNFRRTYTPQETGGVERQMTKSRETAIDIGAGLRGQWGRLNWEAMVGRATYEVRESFPVHNFGDMMRFQLGPELGRTADDRPIHEPDYDRLWYPITPADYESFADRGQKRSRTWLNQAQFVLNGELFEGWAGPVDFAAVLEMGTQGYRMIPEPKTLIDDEDRWGPPFGRLDQGSGERDRYAAGVEFRVPLVKTLDANLAARYDKYDALVSNSKVTYQFGLEWRPIESLLVRGSYGTAFRAPDMHFVYADDTTSVADWTDYLACADGGWPGNRCTWEDGFKVEDANMLRSGTPDLKYEEGESWSAGFVWDAFSGFSLSADYWSINIDNLIDDYSAAQLLLDEAYCQRNGFDPDGRVRTIPPTEAWCAEVASRITRTPGVSATVPRTVSIRTSPINRAETQVRGVDASARYRLDHTRFGTWSFTLNYTNMLSYETRAFPTDPLVDTRATTNPRTRLNLSANWVYNRWTATLLMYQKSGGRATRWGGCHPFDDGYVPSANTGCLDDDVESPTFGQSTSQVFERLPSRRYFNGSVGYGVTDALRVNLYVSNIFDRIYRDHWSPWWDFGVDNPVGREVAAEVVYSF